MDAATELTGTYLQRVPRWWAGKGPAAHKQTCSSKAPPRIWLPRAHPSHRSGRISSLIRVQSGAALSAISKTKQRRVPSRVAAGTAVIE
ncbi:hypothetical protein XvhCFBP2543_11590 [Xanthomonas vasicola]|uniref:Uncharacterized protein n=1 Tax=Xanthomonas vasicola TaxID=56459 RepID=A0ABD7SAC0_XANVA|nr:hypothetical protein NX81_018230 [Xanthomonas vasicola]PPV02370.1 hypothetical protein XvhCFBP2543_11590 [Xanthomonas vasicola]TWQ27186.1 hypothetical protein FQJ97_05285 [Xanthomonas vasicola]TWQ35293.1 hypothetical protein FQJ96_18090 [Xanthomonas vasicola]TWQ53256.1 hypothetical protein FQK01_11110 [Xanthomonas vasicola]